MAPKSWAEEHQLDWLADQAVGFREAQKKTETTPWFAGMTHAWLTKYREEDALWGKDHWERPFSLEQTEQLAAAIEARKAKLYNWFHNHGHKTSRVKGQSEPKPQKLPRIKHRRALQEIELYSHRYYKSRVKANVKKELKRLKKEQGVKTLPSDVRLEVVRRYTANAFENETPEVRAEIAAGAAEEKEQARLLAEANKKGTIVDVDVIRTPQEYQYAIDQAPDDIRRLLTPVHANTGCSIMVIVTGPMPEDGGAIGSFAVHFGENASGHNFAQVTPGFREQYARPHVLFAKGLYPEEVRRERALPSSDVHEELTQASRPSIAGGVGSSSTSPLPALASSSKEIATPLFILDDGAKGKGSSTRTARSRHAHAQFDLSAAASWPPQPTSSAVSSAPGSTLSFALNVVLPDSSETSEDEEEPDEEPEVSEASGHDFSMTPDMPAPPNLGGVDFSMTPNVLPSQHLGGADFSMAGNLMSSQHLGGVDFAMTGNRMLSWDNTWNIPSAPFTQSMSYGTFPLDASFAMGGNIPPFDPALPSGFAQPDPDGGTSFSYNELLDALSLPFPGAASIMPSPSNAPAPSGALTDHAPPSKDLEATTTTSSDSAASPAVLTNATNTEERHPAPDPAPTSRKRAAPSSENDPPPRTTRTGRVIVTPRAKDATPAPYEGRMQGNKRRKVT
ncbi:hypothetical protein K466DRAFT_563401 [Polyporus arcularius HHB13444]|uniref:Uncharacterized protein n=1 Tax=Polyporus arcularius HHB13444 TaxID=1314778 RepID=A0A5C3PMZ3_9APHY|nr:hypothetical protein K466DRAFT_563401 [Polyporus arcularius HHB13444]